MNTPEKISSVYRFKRAREITISGQSVEGKRVTLRLSYAEAAKLAAALLAMLYGSLVEWWRDSGAGCSCPSCFVDYEHHEGQNPLDSVQPKGKARAHP